MSNFLTNTTNLDNVFELRQSGDPALGGLPSGSSNPTSFLTNAQDLEARYAPIEVSGNPSVKAPLTGFIVNILQQQPNNDIIAVVGDMREFFCPKGDRQSIPVVSATNVNETVFGQGGSGTVSGTSTATVTSGGTAPFSYQWTLLSTSGGSITMTNGNTRFATFTSNVGSGNTVTGTARCLVTDSLSQQGLSNTISISLTFIGTV